MTGKSMDDATILPVNNKYNSYFAKVEPQVAKTIIRECIAAGNKRPHDADPAAHDLSALLAASSGGDLDTGDAMRKFQLSLYDAIEKSEAHTFFITGKGASRLYVMCLAGLLSVYAGMKRFVRIELVDPEYVRIPGWSKSRIWLVYVDHLEKERNKEGLSALMVLGQANLHRQLANTFRLPHDSGSPSSDPDAYAETARRRTPAARDYAGASSSSAYPDRPAAPMHDIHSTRRATPPAKPPASAAPPEAPPRADIPEASPMHDIPSFQPATIW
jgi:hypothetical protein